MRLNTKNARRIERLVGLMEQGRAYPAREIYEIACRELSKNYQPINTRTVSRLLGVAASHNMVRRLDTYEMGGPVHYEVIA